MSQKHKLPEIIKGFGATNVIVHTLQEIAPRFEGKTNEEIAEAFGITSNQLERLEKKVGEKYAQNTTDTVVGLLVAGDSVEQPGAFQVFVHESKANTNADGSAKKKISVRTREPMKKLLNPEA